MKKNIAIIIQKLNGGGAERVAANLSQALNDKFQVHLILFNANNIKYPYSGILHDLQLPPLKWKSGKFFQFIRRVLAVRRIKKTNNIETSISLMDGANLINIFSKKGDKIITSIHNQMSKSRFKNRFIKLWNIFIIRYVSFHSDWVVAVSEGVRQDLIQNFGLHPEHLITIYNACAVQDIKQSLEKHKTKKLITATNNVISMGRLIEQKGQWHLIRAFSEVIKVVPDATLYILGEGSLQNKLEQLVKNLNLTHKVIFLGFREPPYPYLALSKVFVLSSLYEGFGNVLIEAMACGTPCISTDCTSGPREILAPGTSILEQLSTIEYASYGVLTSVDNKLNLDANTQLSQQEHQLSQAIIRLLTDEKLRQHYKEQALKRSQNFSQEVIIKRWERLI